MSGASCSRSSTLEYLKRNAPPVNAELPPRASFGAVSIIATEAPASCADSAAFAAALPAPITSTSTLPSSAGVMRCFFPWVFAASCHNGQRRTT